MTLAPGPPEKDRVSVAAYAARASSCSPFVLGLPLFNEAEHLGLQPPTSLPCRNLSSPRWIATRQRKDKQVYPRFCSDRHLSQGHRPWWWLPPGELPLLAPPLRQEWMPVSEPTPPALLPVRHSPSRRRHRRRWWSLTPPFQPSPSDATEGIGVSGLVCSLLQLSSGSPPPGLTVSSSDLTREGPGVGKFLWDLRPSDGPLACP
jgi:hypothetical protein